jgi:hypothetical protein
MTPPHSPVSAALRWDIQNASLRGKVLPIARIGLVLHLPTRDVAEEFTREDAWLDTGAPVSIIPFRIHSMGLVWQPMTGIQARWSGIICDLGTIDVWLVDRATQIATGPFAMFAKFPRADPPGKPHPILVGLEFVLAHQGAFHMRPHPALGSLELV